MVEAPPALEKLRLAVRESRLWVLRRLRARIVDQLVTGRLTSRKRHRLRRRLAEVDNQIAALEALRGR